jgi:hypothetical protein
MTIKYNTEKLEQAFRMLMEAVEAGDYTPCDIRLMCCRIVAIEDEDGDKIEIRAEYIPILVRDMVVGIAMGMQVRNLYIVNDGASDIDMLLVSCMLNPMDYNVIKGRCGDHEFESVGAAYYEECIDEIEVEVDGRPLGRVINDLYNIYGTYRVLMEDIIFVAETEHGEYIQFGRREILDIEEEEFEEEL